MKTIDFITTAAIVLSGISIVSTVHSINSDLKDSSQQVMLLSKKVDSLEIVVKQKQIEISKQTARSDSLYTKWNLWFNVFAEDFPWVDRRVKEDIENQTEIQ